MQLLDGQILDAAREGDWPVVIAAASVLVLGLVLGALAWLKGRKVPAALTWILLITALTLTLVPLSSLEATLAIDAATLNWVAAATAGAGLAIGLIAAIRLARPPSWWAQRRYDNDTYAEAIERHHWTRVKPR